MNKLRSWLKTPSFLPWIGFACTFGYFGLIIQIYGERLFELQFMPLNEVGDFLAGAFGPVAFLWLIIGYIMQNIDLNLTRNISTESLDHQKRLQQISFKKSHDESQPELDFEKVTFESKIDNELNFKIVVRNSGARISNFYIYDYPSSESSIYMDQLIKKIDSDSSEKFYLTIPITFFNEQPLNQITLNAAFLDNRKEHKETEVKITCYNKNYPVNYHVSIYMIPTFIAGDNSYDH